MLNSSEKDILQIFPACQENNERLIHFEYEGKSILFLDKLFVTLNN
jgi:hypothetical protein